MNLPFVSDACARPSVRPLVALAALGACLLALVAVAEEPKKTKRPYRDGPLAAEDFAATPDDEATYAAWTYTDFEIRYEWKGRVQKNLKIITLTEIEIWAVVDREKSWIRRVKDPVLLDHEQGHFDVTQLHALAAQLKLQRTLDNVDVPQGRAASQADAVKALDKQVRAIVQLFIDDGLAANREYDKATNNGRDVAAQAEARRKHREQFDKVTKELAELEK